MLLAFFIEKNHTILHEDKITIIYRQLGMFLLSWKMLSLFLYMGMNQSWEKYGWVKPRTHCSCNQTVIIFVEDFAEVLFIQTLPPWVWLPMYKVLEFFIHASCMLRTQIQGPARRKCESSEGWRVLRTSKFRS
jgi:hypothetical protein